MNIIDGHCHVASTRFIPRQFLDGVAAAMNRKLVSYGQKTDINKLRELIYKQNSDHEADELVREMNEADIQRTILLVPDFSFAMPCELTLEEMADAHVRIRERHPGRFVVFIGADPSRGKAGVDLFRRHVQEYGFEGLKLYPPCGYSPSDHRLFPYYEICQEFGLPVLLHTGPTSRSLLFNYAAPGLIDEASRTFRDVDFILAHGGVSYIDDCVNYAKYRENVYIDVGGFTGGIFHDGWAPHLKRLFALGVNHKIIFGSDWPISRMSGGLKKLAKYFREESVKEFGITEFDLGLITSGNISRVLDKRRATS